MKNKIKLLAHIFNDEHLIGSNELEGANFLEITQFFNRPEFLEKYANLLNADTFFENLI